MIIAFVGIDGAGKSSIIEATKEYLEAQDYRVLVFKTSNRNSEFSHILSEIKKSCIQRGQIPVRELNQIVANMLAFEILRDSKKIDELKESYDFILLDRWSHCQEIYGKIWFVWNDFIKCCLDQCLIPDKTFLISADMKNIEKRLAKRTNVKSSEDILALRRAKKMYARYAIKEKWTEVINDNCIEDSIDTVIKVLRDNE